MDVFMEICQGLGLALAVGIGGPIAALFISMMGSLDAGIHPDGSDYGFLSATWFLVTLLALVVLGMLARNKASLRIPTIAVLAAIGAIVCAASFAENGDIAWPGLIFGAVATAFAAVISYDVLEGAMSRAKGNEPGSTEADAANALIIGFAAAGIVLAALCLFIPPISLAVLAALVYLAVSRRRRADEKYEGLRILR
jgi:CHASE2 domain-containing sensor protein